jgi:CRISPR-associated protein Csm3
MDIGGMDSPVIKTPLGVPYIPGSSLKGKIRTLLTKSLNGAEKESDDTDIIRKMFGCADKVKGEITRLIFRDAWLDKEDFEKTFIDNNAILETSHTEGKWENKIDRKKGKAENPRQLERVPAGTKFSFEIVADIYEGDDKEEMVSTLKNGFTLLQDDYLGGSGTRGYGKVNITITSEQPKNYHS